MAVAELKEDLDRAIMMADRSQVILLSAILERLQAVEERVRTLETRQSPETYLPAR